jgi:hypothetical protein
MAYPFVQFLKRAFDLGKSEVGGESPKLRRKGDYDVLKTAAAPRAQDFPDSAAYPRRIGLVSGFCSSRPTFASSFFQTWPRDHALAFGLPVPLTTARRGFAPP